MNNALLKATHRLTQAARVAVCITLLTYSFGRIFFWCCTSTYE